MNPTRDKEIDPNSFALASEQFILALPDYQLVPDERSLLLLDEMFKDKETLNSLDDEGFEKLFIYYGSFLGECVKKIFDGQWIFSEQAERWGVEVPLRGGGNIFLNPFHKIGKILNQEEEAGAIAYWYDMTKELIKNDGNIPGEL